MQGQCCPQSTRTQAQTQFCPQHGCHPYLSHTLRPSPEATAVPAAPLTSKPPTVSVTASRGPSPLSLNRTPKQNPLLGSSTEAKAALRGLGSFGLPHRTDDKVRHVHSLSVTAGIILPRCALGGQGGLNGRGQKDSRTEQSRRWKATYAD